MEDTFVSPPCPVGFNTITTNRALCCFQEVRDKVAQFGSYEEYLDSQVRPQMEAGLW